MTNRPDPVLAADAEAIHLARALMQDARSAALAWVDPVDGAPGISRIAFGVVNGAPMTLISALAPHFGALQASPDCAVMLGEVGGKGDPLTHPRLMLRTRAEFVADRRTCRDQWLKDHPKAALYVDFADFAFVRLIPVSALLNAGFARAYRLMPEDLRP